MCSVRDVQCAWCAVCVSVWDRWHAVCSPVIVAGDCNRSLKWVEVAHAVFATHDYATNKKTLHRTKDIDHILYAARDPSMRARQGNAEQFLFTRYEALEMPTDRVQIDMSDHRPIIAEIKLYWALSGKQ